MFENLDHPYTFNNNFKHNLKTITFVSMGFMLIMLYFQPFGINFLASVKNGYFVLGTGFLSAITFFFSTLILPGIFPRLFDPSKWTIRKELIWNFGMLLVLFSGFSFIAWLFNYYNLIPLPIPRSGALAVMPLVLFNLLNYNHSLKAKVVHAIDSGRHWLAEERKPAAKGKTRLRIVADNGKEEFDQEMDQVAVVRSASNYIEVFWLDGKTIRKILIRQTLNTVESLVKDYPDIKKCHRCYLVNIKHVARLTGINPNYSLLVNGLDLQIPVSRQNVTIFRKLLGSWQLIPSEKI